MNWEIIKSIDDDLFFLGKEQEQKKYFATLYIHTFTFHVPRTVSKTTIFNKQYPGLETIEKTGDKLRYYRYQKALLQKDVAAYVGIDRGTYNAYETGAAECPIEILKRIAEVLEVEALELMDEYNLFLYKGQGLEIRNIRKKLGFTQRKFAQAIGVHAGTVKKWELERVRITRSSYEKIVKLNNMGAI